MYNKFVHLRAHTSYSLAEGAIKVPDLVDLCKKHSLPALAVTDSGNLFCALEFCNQAISQGIKPILGVTISFDSMMEKDGYGKVLDKIVILAKNNAGYKNLFKLVSMSFDKDLSITKNYITIEELKKYSEGLIILTAGFEGTFGRLLLLSEFQEAEKFIVSLKKIFNNNLYIEVIRRGILEEEKKESYLLESAYKHNIPLVATNEVFYSDQKMHEAHDVLLCIAAGKYIEDQERPRSNHEAYFKSAKEMSELFADIPEAIANTVIIAKRCSVIAEERAPMLPKMAENEKATLIEQAKKGLIERLHNVPVEDHKKYHDRMEYELSVITEMDFSGYFLIVSDFIKWSKEQKIPVGPGRGSGAGSIVAWSLYITDLDPLKFGLIFERFLNPERISMPDFDIDFCQDRREEVIQYVRKKYGNNRVAQIITFGKLQAKAVIRDVGRVLQLPYSQVDRISKMIPFNPVNPVTLEKAITMEPMLQKEQRDNDQISRLLSIALKLEGLNRHASTHAAGIVIGDRDLEEVVPLYKDPRSEMSVVQYSMKYAEMAGLVKFDFLGLKTLTIIDSSVKLIKKTIPQFKLENINLDDIKTYQMLSTGDSTGVFQFESAGMRDTLRKLKPDHINDLMALGALYRPGPMDNIPVYIACKHGKQKPDYLHSCLKEVLEETFGVIIYQEQVLKVAQQLAGYSLGSADLLRRAMGKKIKSEMDAQREMFVSGALKNNIDEEQASKIFDLVAKFAGYGFNRAHAASYAIISYQTAYLKANFPLQFLTACLNIESDDTDKINLFFNDARSHEINIMPPDINLSQDIFSIFEDKISYGLAALKNVGKAAILEIITERKNNGDFKNIFDFLKRIPLKSLNKRLLESLIKSGAFDSFHSNRKQLFDSVEILMNYHSYSRKEMNTNQISLFGKSNDEISLPNLIECNDWDSINKAKNEYESFGFYLTNHPLDRYKNILQSNNIKDSKYIKEELREGYTSQQLAAVVLQVKTRMSPRGRYVSLLASDINGSYDITIFNDDILANSNEMINNNAPLWFQADIKKDEGGIRVTATKVALLDDYLSSKYNALKIYIDDTNAIVDFKNLINSLDAGRTKIYLSVITKNNDEVEIELPGGYSIDSNLVENLQNNTDFIKKIVMA
jgi:DNA polymerase III subunit alpha